MLIGDHGRIRERMRLVLQEAGLTRQALIGAEDALYDVAVSSHVDITAMLSAVRILLERGM